MTYSPPSTIFRFTSQLIPPYGGSKKVLGVPSAQEGLTSVFGMGTGGSPPLLSPGNNYIFEEIIDNMVKPHGYLVLVG